MLEKFLQPNSDISTENVVRAVADMLPKPSERDRSGEEAMFGGLLREITEQIPYHHPSQIKLARFVQQLTHVLKTTAKVEEGGHTYYVDPGEFLSNLRGYSAGKTWFLSNVMISQGKHTETDNQFQVQFEVSDGPKEFTKFVDFHAFLANLTASIFIDDTLCAIWFMRDALEEEVEDYAVDNCAVSAAAVWFLFCGQKLFMETVQLPMEIMPELRGRAGDAVPCAQHPPLE